MKRAVMYSIICVVSLASASWGQARQVARSFTKTVKTHRVSGAKPEGMNKYQLNWQRTYLLNDKFLTQLSNEVIDNLNYRPEQIRYATQGLPKASNSFQRSLQEPGLSGGWELQHKQLSLISKNYQERVAWLQAQPNQGMDRLGIYTGGDASRVLALKLQNENLIFVGEYHNIPVLRDAFVSWVEALHQLEPKRKIVVFAESLYLQPIANESVVPYTYYRRAEEGVEPALNISDADNPALTFMHVQPSYQQMLQRLDALGVQIYPVEDAVVGQKQLAQEEMGVFKGLKERNAGFARVMRAQMERIRQTEPEALFIYYGGTLHVSWAFPASLPKMFADEFPVVVEMTAPKNLLGTHSILSGVWPVTHEVFDSSITTPRLFYWKGEPETSRAWGKQIGFNFTMVVPE